MPKRNYGFEKRQKELARQEKRAAKEQRRLERRQAADPVSEPGPSGPDQPPPAESSSP